MTPPDLDYRDVFGSMPVPATLIDADGIIVDVNRAFLAIARRAGRDLRLEDRVGHPVSEFVDADFRAAWDAFLADLLAGRPTLPLRQSSTDSTGREFLQEIRGQVLRDAHANIIGAAILRGDITDEAAQAARLEDSTRLLTAFQHLGEMVVSSLDREVVLDTISEEIVRAAIFRSLMVALVDPDDGSVTVVRSFVCSLTPEGDAIPETARRHDVGVVGLTYPRDDANITAEVARTGELTVIGIDDPRHDPRRTPDKKPKLSYFIPVTHADRVLAVLATASPIDRREQTLDRIEMMRPLLNQVAIALNHARLFEERRRATRAQQVSLAVQRVRNSVLEMRDESGWSDVVERLSDELSALIAYSGCGVQLVEEDGSMVGYSRGVGALEAYPFSVAPGPVRRALETGQPQYRRNRGEMAAGGDDVGMEKVGAHSVVDVPFAGGTLAVNSQRESGFSDSDIAVLVDFAAVVGEARQRLGELRELAQKEQQLQQSQKMEAVGQLTAGVAHNFNNMLQGVIGNLELALLDAGPAVQPAIESALQSTHRAGEVVQQLMVFSREGRRLPRRAVDIAAVIRDTEAICRKTFDRRIQIHVERRAAPHTLGDARQLQQVFLNLCLNARDSVIEYCQSVPTIRISWEEMRVEEGSAPATCPPGPYLRVEVADNGKGLDAETQQRVFEPFFSTKPLDRGTGLGLSTAFGIIQEHDGWLECDSQPGDGARFSVYLPVATPEDTVEGTVASSPSKLPPAGGTILVVDDEDVIRETAQQMLELRGFSVLMAADGEQAIEAISGSQGTISLVLLDQSMPGLSGRQVLDYIRSEAPDTRVIIFTGFLATVEEFEGADDLIRKPFTLDGLTSKVREVLARPRHEGV